MDLLIISTGVAVAGYLLNTNGRSPRDQAEIDFDQNGNAKLMNEYPFPNDNRYNEVRNQIQDVLHDQNLQAQYFPNSHVVPLAAEGGLPSQDNNVLDYVPFHNNMVPFFRGTEVKQYDERSGENMQRRLDLYTGAGDGGGFEVGMTGKKTEVPYLFEPFQNYGNPYGAPNSNEFEKSRIVASGLQNNTLPFEQVRVGPGLNVGPDVPAVGGFQQNIRFLPNNVNDYKLNTLPGRIIPGRAQVEERGIVGVVEKKQPETTWTLDRRPVQPNSTATTGPMMRPDYTWDKWTDRVDENPYLSMGGGGPAGASVPGQINRMEYDQARVRDDRTAAFLPGPVGGAVNGEMSRYGYTNYETERSMGVGTGTEGNTQFGAAGVRAAVPGLENRFGDAARITQRQTTNYDRNGNLTGPVPGTENRFGDAARITQRQTTQTDYQNAPGASVPGPANQYEYYNSGSYSLRDAANVQGWAPGGGRMNVLQDPDKRLGNMEEFVPINELNIRQACEGNLGGQGIMQYYGNIGSIEVNPNRELSDKCITVERNDPAILNALRSNPLSKFII